MKKLAFSLLLLLCCLNAGAEIFVGRVVDAKTGEPLSHVQISVSWEMTGMYGSAGIAPTDSTGCFEINSQDGKNTITFSLIGYNDVERTRICTKENQDTVKLGDVKLKLSDILLKSATVKAKRKLFYFRGDTIVYDPIAFNLRKGERIGRLLQKLPGVVVDEFGGLTWNGQHISMLVNGKENEVVRQFLPQLPAEAVDKIKVYDKRSEQDIREHRKGRRVLDVKIKPEWMEKWYGNIGVLSQTEGYYNLNANGYRLSDVFPFNSYFNLGDGNYNFSPSSDGMKSLKKRTDAAVRNLDIGAIAQNSLYKSDGKEIRGRAHTVETYLKHSDTRSGSHSKTENFMSDNSSTYSTGESSNYSHNLEIRPLRVGITRQNNKRRISVAAAATFIKSDGHSESRNAVFNTSPYGIADNPLDAMWSDDATTDSLRSLATTSSERKGLSESKQFQTSGSFDYYYNLSKKNTVGLHSEIGYKDKKGNSHSLYDTRQYNRSINSEKLDKQYASNPTRNIDVNVVLSDMQRIFERSSMNQTTMSFNIKSLSITPKYNFRYTHDYNNYRAYRWNLDDVSQDDLMHKVGYLPSDEAEMLLAQDSVNTRRKQTDIIAHGGGLELNYRWNNLSLTPTFEYKVENERMEYARGRIDTVARRTNLLPKFNIYMNYTMKKLGTLSFSASHSKTAGNFEQKMAYTDDSNPLYIYRGNPLLRSTRHFTSNLGYSRTFAKLQMMGNASIGYSRDHNPWRALMIYDRTTGVTQSMMDNIRGGHRWDGTLNAEWTPTNRLRFSNRLNLSLAKQYSFLLMDAANREEDRILNAQHNRRIQDDLALTYNGENLELKGRVLLVNSNWSNSAGTANDYNYWDYTFSLEGSYHLNDYWTFNMDAAYEGKDGYMSSFMNKDRFLMDASVDLHILRGRGTISLIAADIFNQNTAHRYTATANSRTESDTFSIHHYYCMKFVYNFDGRKDKK